LRGERRGLARALEALAAGGGPGERVALAIGDRDDRVVEGRVHVADAVAHVLADLLAHTLRGVAGGSLGHVLSLSRIYFFSAWAALRGPLRVRALVRVRWPRMGRPRR